MTKIGDVLKRRATEQSRIRKQLNSMRAEEGPPEGRGGCGRLGKRRVVHRM